VEHFWQTIEGWSQFTDQGILLGRILPTSDYVRIAEVGVYCGRGTAMWTVELLNRSLKFDYFAIDHFKGSVEHEKRDFYEEALRNLAPVLPHVNILKMNSRDAARSFPDQHFDIVYIDASHDYRSVKRDVDTWYPKVRVGGYIAGDDYIAGWPGVVGAVDAFLSQNSLSLIRVGEQQWAAQKLKHEATHPGFWRRLVSRRSKPSPVSPS
jgi:predicted O-methyltransferase YrrM